jgi:hypothetical protein
MTHKEGGNMAQGKTKELGEMLDKKAIFSPNLLGGKSTRNLF